MVSGRGRVKFITGGADMVIPLFHTWNSLSLEVMTLDVTTPEVYTSQGVPILVDGVAQIKIKKDEASLHAAAERFLGKPPQEIAKIALETVQGHLRAILGTLSVEDIYKNRDQFAQKVQEISAGDLANMGLGIDSFTIRDIRDKHGYLEALGKAHRGGEAHRRHRRSGRDQGIDGRPGRRGARDSRAAGRSSEARPGGRGQARRRGRGSASGQEPAPGGGAGGAHRASEVANSQAAQAIAEQQREANLKKADADMAYELQKKTIEIRVQEQEILRREKELDATIRRQADAKRYEIETLAAAELKKVENQASATKTQGLADAHVKQTQGVAQAEVNKAQGIAEAEIRQAQGLAVAEAQKAQGLAEALAMEKKAEAWKKYNEAAVLQILAPILPEIARAIAEPLSKIDRITLVNTGNGDSGISRVTNEIAKVITQVPPVVESLTGLNMEKLFDHLRESPSKDEPPKK